MTPAASWNGRPFTRKPELHLTMHYQFYDGIPVVRSWTEVTNCGTEAQGLEALSSFCLMGLGKEGLIRPDRKLRLSVPHHSWKRKCTGTDTAFPIWA